MRVFENRVLRILVFCPKRDEVDGRLEKIA
jgi:hypothetical protein